MISAKASERKHRGVSLLKCRLVLLVFVGKNPGVRFLSYQEPVKRRRYPEPEHCAQIIHFGSQRQDGALPGRKCRLCTSWSGWEEFERRWCRVFQRRSAVPQGFQGVIESFLLQFFANRMSFLCRVLFLQDFGRTLLIFVNLLGFLVSACARKSTEQSPWAVMVERRADVQAQSLTVQCPRGIFQKFSGWVWRWEKELGGGNSKIFCFHPWGRWTHFDLRIFFKGVGSTTN